MTIPVNSLHPATKEQLIDSVSTAAVLLTQACHQLAANAGWWNDKQGNPVQDQPNIFAAKLMLCVTELAEACEGDRKSLMDDHLPHRSMREVELADTVIRIFDLAGAFNMDLAGAIKDKLRYNTQRADHKPENRAKDGGKAY